MPLWMLGYPVGPHVGHGTLESDSEVKKAPAPKRKPKKQVSKDAQE